MWVKFIGCLFLTWLSVATAQVDTPTEKRYYDFRRGDDRIPAEESVEMNPADSLPFVEPELFDEEPEQAGMTPRITPEADPAGYLSEWSEGSRGWLFLDNLHAEQFERRYLRPAYLRDLLPNPERPAVHYPKLPLQWALQMALEENFDIQIQRSVIEIEDYRMRQTFGAFDPRFETSGTLRESRVPQNTQEFISSGGQVEDLVGLNGNSNPFDASVGSVELKFEQRMPYGVTYGLRSTLVASTTDLTREDERSVFDPEFESFFGLDLTVPLMRGFGTDANLAPLRIAQRNKRIADTEFRGEVLIIIARTMRIYYDFLLAYQEMRLQAVEIDVFQALLSKKRRDVERGQASIRDIAAIQARITESRDDLFQAEQRLEDARSLLFLLTTGRAEREAMQDALPEGWVVGETPDFNASYLIGRALQRRPDYHRAALAIERSRYELTAARDEQLPQLDIVASAGLRGISDNPFSSYGETVRADFPEVSVGVVFSRPWGNVEADNRVREVLSARRRLMLERSSIENTIVHEVTSALEQIELQERRLANAQELRELFEQEIDQEQILVESGEKSIYDTLNFHTDLSNARLRELTVLNDLAKSRVDLFEASGTLLEEIGVQVVDAL
ncbi:MAG: TolC family protein [Verrucomicrobiota bacterium]